MQERAETPLSVRAPSDIIKKLTAYAEDHGISRSKAIVRALANLVTSVECVSCGAHNPKNGKKCAVCEEVLYSDYEIKQAIANICVYKHKDHEYVLLKDTTAINRYIDAGLSPEFVPVIDRSGTVTEYYGEFQLFTKDRLALAPVGYNDKLMITTEELLKELPIVRESCRINKERGLIPDSLD